MKKIICTMLLLVTAGALFAQEFKASKTGFYLDGPIITDSATTLMIPIGYSASIFSSNKFAAWGSYYANLVFYNFKTDSSFRLFDRDTYIMNFKTYYFDKISYRIQQTGNFSRDWILYRVKNVDTNKNGRIDQHDPDILYVSDVLGKNLHRITNEHDHVISIEIYSDQNFALLKLQQDSGHDGNYKSEDRDFCYVRLDLTTLKLGQRINTR